MDIFLNKYRIKDGVFTHTSIIPAGKYNIPDLELDNFYNLYDIEIKNGKILYLTEVPLKEYGPIKLDIDFKVDISLINENVGKNHIYTLKTIHNLIKIYIDELLKIATIETDKLIYVISEKSQMCIRGNIGKDGFHILFPYLVSEYSVQHFIRDILIIKFNEIFNDLSAVCINSPKDIIDISVISRNNWCMNGSKSKEDGQVYKITEIAQFRINDIGESRPFIKKIFGENDFKNIYRMLSINHPIKRNINVKIIEEQKKYIEEQKKNNNKEKKIEKEKIVEKEEILRLSDNNNQLTIKDKLQLIELLINCLSVERATSYSTWIEVCWCLRSINKNLFIEFIKFSRKCPEKFNEAECECVWERSRPDGRFTIASLHYWAKLDNPELYSNIMQLHIQNKMDKLDKNHVDIAEIVYEIYKHNFMFVCTDTNRRGGVWYEFIGHQWICQPDGINLRAAIKEDIYSRYIALNAAMLERARECVESEVDKNYFVKKAEAAMGIAKSLRNTPFINNVVLECQFMFRDLSFEAKLNSNNNLIGLGNGVYDLEGGTFRAGRPDDFISMNTMIDWIPIANQREKCEEVLRFFKDIIPNEKIREYLLKVTASCLDGFNRDEKFYILTGNGRNGKSKVIQLLQEVLGQYSVSLPIALITQKRASSGQASPEVVKMAKKRLAIFKEPDNITDSVLNMGMIKDLTGNDSISCRKLYSNDDEFRVSSKIILMCNQLPEIASDDDGTWDRIRVINFPVHFTHKVINENDRLIDESIGQKIMGWKEPFLAILIRYYKKYRQEGLVEPPNVCEATMKYRERNNIFLQFVKENIKYMPEGSKKIELNVNILYTTFIGWCESEFQKKRGMIPNKREFQGFIKNHFGPNYNEKNNVIKQCTLLVDEVDIEDELIIK